MASLMGPLRQDQADCTHLAADHPTGCPLDRSTGRPSGSQTRRPAGSAHAVAWLPGPHLARLRFPGRKEPAGVASGTSPCSPAVSGPARTCVDSSAPFFCLFTTHRVFAISSPPTRGSCRRFLQARVSRSLVLNHASATDQLPRRGRENLHEQASSLADQHLCVIVRIGGRG